MTSSSSPPPASSSSPSSAKGFVEASVAGAGSGAAILPSHRLNIFRLSTPDENACRSMDTSARPSVEYLRGEAKD
jgi:hypothetical protein